MAYLLDSNILVRLFSEGDPAQAEVAGAIDRLKSRGESLCFVLQNSAEFWNVATRPKERNGLGLTPAEADTLLNEAEALFDVLPDPPGTYRHWRRLVREAGVSGVQVHDARLVAWMLAHGVTHLLTRDPDDFRRYAGPAGITVVEPREVAA